MSGKQGSNDSTADLLERLAAKLREEGVEDSEVNRTIERVRSSRRPPAAEYSYDVRRDRTSIDRVPAGYTPPRKPPQAVVDGDTFPERERDSKVIINVGKTNNTSKPPKSEEDQFAEKVKKGMSPLLTILATLLGGGGVAIGVSHGPDRSDLIYQVMKEELGKQETRIQTLELNARVTASWNLGVLKAQGVNVAQDTTTPEPADVKVQVRPTPAPAAGSVARSPRAPNGVVPAEVNILTTPPVPPAPVALEAAKLPATLDELAKKREPPAQGK